MPDWCLDRRCIDCESHAIVGGKIDCNYLNRLGLSQPTVKTFLPEEPTPEKLEASLADIEKRKKELEEELKKIEEIKKSRGGESSVSVS